MSYTRNSNELLICVQVSHLHRLGSTASCLNHWSDKILLCYALEQGTCGCFRSVTVLAVAFTQSVFCMLIQLLLKLRWAFKAWIQFSSSALLMRSCHCEETEDSNETFQIFNYAFEVFMLYTYTHVDSIHHPFNVPQRMMSCFFPLPVALVLHL